MGSDRSCLTQLLGSNNTFSRLFCKKKKKEKEQEPLTRFRGSESIRIFEMKQIRQPDRNLRQEREDALKRKASRYRWVS